MLLNSGRANYWIYMAGSWLLRASEIKGCWRHLKWKFQIESNQCGRSARQSTGVMRQALICVLFNSAWLDYNGERSQTLEEGPALQSWLGRPSVMIKGFGLHTCHCVWAPLTLQASHFRLKVGFWSLPIRQKSWTVRITFQIFLNPLPLSLLYYFCGSLTEFEFLCTPMSLGDRNNVSPGAHTHTRTHTHTHTHARTHNYVCLLWSFLCPLKFENCCVEERAKRKSICRYLDLGINRSPVWTADEEVSEVFLLAAGLTQLCCSNKPLQL
jgi:hypothetical protein